jgi:LysR family transcriptional activator of nhaA
VRAASRELHVTQPTISEQVRQLEETLGTQLFRREGRRMELTERGEVVYRYAESIFAIGDELLDALADRPPGHNRRFVVGVADVLPKVATVKLLEPVLADPTVRLVVQESPPDHLLIRLENHALDAVLTDAPARPTVAPRAVSHLLGESGIAFFARHDLAQRYRDGFPHNLNGAPVLLPQPHNSLRQSLDRWFRQSDLRPDTVGEFDDGAMIKAFGQDGFGLFPAPTVVAQQICRQYHVDIVGTVPDVFERFYLVTLDGASADPAARAIRTAARQRLFGAT